MLTCAGEEAVTSRRAVPACMRMRHDMFLGMVRIDECMNAEVGLLIGLAGELSVLLHKCVELWVIDTALQGPCRLLLVACLHLMAIAVTAVRARQGAAGHHGYFFWPSFLEAPPPDCSHE
jgi:hypothetical protein